MMFDVIIHYCVCCVAVIVYTGNSEKGTGNWCFMDGTITFRDIYDLYMMHYRGKRLMIVSDCSYSGCWITDCIDVLDSEGIPSCGHHTRNRGILLEVIASCEADKEAKMLGMPHPRFDQLKACDQIPVLGDFTRIRCRRGASESCEINTDSGYTWRDKLINGPGIYQRLDLVHKTKYTWCYMLVKQEKLELYKEAMKKGRVDFAKYCEVLHSDLNDTAADDIRIQLNLQYNPEF